MTKSYTARTIALSIIADGGSISDAATRTGYSRSTIYRWRREEASEAAEREAIWDRR